MEVGAAVAIIVIFVLLAVGLGYLIYRETRPRSPEEEIIATLKQEVAESRKTRARKKLQLDLLRYREQLDKSIEDLDKKIDSYYAPEKEEGGKK